MSEETKRILLVTLKLKYPGSPMQVTCHLITNFFFLSHFPIFLHPIEFGWALAIETRKYMIRDSSGSGIIGPNLTQPGTGSTLGMIQLVDGDTVDLKL